MLFSLLLSLFLIQRPIPSLETGVITGVIKQADGSPAVQVHVAAMPAGEGLAEGNAGQAPSPDAGTLVALGQTDDSGRYRLESVPVGRYYVVAGRVNAPTFYPGVTQPSAATVVSVTRAAEITNIDFTISKTSTQPDSPFGNNNPFLSLQPFMSLLTPKPQVPLQGRIVLDDASKGQKLPERVTLNVQNVQTPPNLPALDKSVRIFFPQLSSTSVRAAVAADGTFTLNAPEGEGAVSVVGLPSGYSVKSVTAGGTDLLKYRFDIKQGGPEIVITVSADFRPRFLVQGSVISASGRDLFGEQIELVTESGTTTRLILGAGGTFAFTNVLPGTYTLRVNSPTAGNIKQSITVVDSEVNVELRP